MKPAFEGTALVSLDAKGRFAVPALFRDALFGASACREVVLVRHPDGCLVVYPREAWLEKRAQLAALPFSARAFVRLVLGSARTVAPDAAGRILVPADLRTLAGLERSAVMEAAAPEEVKSVSNERTFCEDLTEADQIRAGIAHVSEMVGRRLRRKGLRGHTVTLKVKYDAAHARTTQRSLGAPTDDERVFGRVAQSLLDELWSPGMRVRLLGVGVSGFDDGREVQMSLFAGEGEGAGDRDRSALGRACDALRERFGDGAVGYGRDLRFSGSTSDTAPMHKDL